MASTFDMVNNALMRELERLDEANPATEEGRAEIERAKAVHSIGTAATANARTAVEAMRSIQDMTGAVVKETSIPRMLADA